MAGYNRGTEGRLNDILTILGTTKTSLWPFWEHTGTLVSCIGIGDCVASETGGAAEALEDDFAPVQLPCGFYSYHFNPTGDHHLAGIDHANYSFVAAPFSVGCWIRPSVITTGVMLAKYDAVGNADEWRFGMAATGVIALELYDASASASEIGLSSEQVGLGTMEFVVATYDGTPATPDVHIYIDGVDENPTGATTETGAFVDMEALAAPLTIGCDGVTAAPTNEFHGRIFMPFITGKELTAAEVVTLRDIMRPMVGIA